jgi:hypothetical protein
MFRGCGAKSLLAAEEIEVLPSVTAKIEPTAIKVIVFLRHIMLSYRYARILRQYLPELWYLFI